MEKKPHKSHHRPFGAVQIIMIVLFLIAAYLAVTLKSKIDDLQSLEAQPTPLAQVVPTDSVPVPTTETDSTLPQPTAGAPKTYAAKGVPPITAEDWVRGNRNAPLAMIEYSDYECQYCKVFHPTAKQVADAYGNKLMWVYRHFPLTLHVNAYKEAEAAQCAGAVGGNEAFWKYTDAIFERTTSYGSGFSRDALVPLAKEIGLDEKKFTDCQAAGKMMQVVIDQQTGGERAGVTGTPATVILNVKTGENKQIPGSVPFDQLKPVIDDMLKRT